MQDPLPGSAVGSPADDESPDVFASSLSGAVAEYMSLSDSLKRLRGTDFEDYDHPAVVLDRATDPSTRFWGWWADAQPRLPCLLWVSERGWSATVVEPDALDHEGYERPFWSHRVGLLDVALACALGPCSSLEELQHQVALDGSFGFGERAAQLQAAVLWGIVQVRAAQAARGQCPTAPGVCPREAPAKATATADLALVRSGLIPTLVRRSRRRRRRSVVQQDHPGQTYPGQNVPGQRHPPRQAQAG